ncbi:unnamed protein product [Prorocentrum cordatum]|uniref:Uncharacterized protein n=1 Tax=Prorocentrum cordatum TaxID=2364126 RepID=A0ABN9XTR6_9DINO|nr:unnamed protein product [Polarella glacialis]
MASPEADRAAAPLLPSSLSAAPRRVAARVATSTQGAAHSAARHGRLFTLDSDGATSEVYLGIGATLLGTLAIWMVCMPVFDIGGTALIRRFEGNSSAGHREPVRLCCGRWALCCGCFVQGCGRFLRRRR